MMSKIVFFSITLILLMMVIISQGQSRCFARIGEKCDLSDTECCSPDCSPYLYQVTCTSCRGTVCRCKEGRCVTTTGPMVMGRSVIVEHKSFKNVNSVTWPNILIIIIVGLMIGALVGNILWCISSAMASKSKIEEQEAFQQPTVQNLGYNDQSFHRRLNDTMSM